MQIIVNFASEFEKELNKRFVVTHIVENVKNMMDSDLLLGTRNQLNIVIFTYPRCC